MRSSEGLITAPQRCIVCGRADHLRLHHVAGRANLPTVVVGICKSRHPAWHRLLRARGVDLLADNAHAWVYAVLNGFAVIFEDASALSDDPRASRIGLRRSLEQNLALAGRFLPAKAAGDGEVAVPPPRRAPTRGSTSDGRDCRPSRPRSQGEQRGRAEAFVGGLVGALADLLDALLPAELAPLDLPARLRRIDRRSLALAALNSRGKTTDTAWRSKMTTLRETRKPSLDQLGACLDACVSSLEAMAEGETR